MPEHIKSYALHTCQDICVRTTNIQSIFYAIKLTSAQIAKNKEKFALTQSSMNTRMEQFEKCIQDIDSHQMNMQVQNNYNIIRDIPRATI